MKNEIKQASRISNSISGNIQAGGCAYRINLRIIAGGLPQWEDCRTIGGSR
ncbi:MAG: hypothetical protein JWQ98_2557 [Chlorobi bacterium]|jgi:hypothetical protein|nr:hypothetical protein [Chlorobiota bacterium]